MVFEGLERPSPSRLGIAIFAAWQSTSEKSGRHRQMGRQPKIEAGLLGVTDRETGAPKARYEKPKRECFGTFTGDAEQLVKMLHWWHAPTLRQISDNLLPELPKCFTAHTRSGRGGDLGGGSSSLRFSVLLMGGRAQSTMETFPTCMSAPEIPPGQPSYQRLLHSIPPFLRLGRVIRLRRD